MIALSFKIFIGDESSDCSSYNGSDIEDDEVYFKSHEEVIPTDDLQEMGFAGSDELRTMHQLIAMGFKMEDTLYAIKAINATDLTSVLDYLTSQDHQGTFW